jgi:post-segregation antitoxin (ccd killing protein)
MTSRIAEEALAVELQRREREAIREEIQAYGAFVDKYGSFADLVRRNDSSIRNIPHEIG